MECMAVAQKIQSITVIAAYIVTLKYSLREITGYIDLHKMYRNIKKRFNTNAVAVIYRCWLNITFLFFKDHKILVTINNGPKD